MTNSTTIKRALLRSGSAFQALALLGAGVATSAIMAAPAAAQDYTNITASGRVQGTNGDGIGGATVTVTSDGQGFSRTVTTDSSGGYRVPQIPAGPYTFSVTADGYETYTEAGILLNQSNAANQFTLSSANAVATGDDIIVTAGRVQVVDFERTTTGAVIQLGELATRVPVARDITSVILLAPGTTQGDSAFGSLPNLRGASVAENAYFINGLNITQFRQGLAPVAVPFDFYETVDIKTGGFPAEFGRATGGIIVATTKSGSNEFHGGVTFNWEPDALRSDAPNTLFADNERDYLERKDVVLELSGPIIKDRLFFYGIYNARDVVSEDGATSAVGTQAASLTTTGSTFTRDRNDDPFWGVKLDGIILDGHRVEATYFNTESITERSLFSYDAVNNTPTVFRSGSRLRAGGENYVFRYTGQFTEWLTLSGAYGKNKQQTSIESSTPDLGSVIDSRTGQNNAQRGNPTANSSLNFDEREFYRADADIFVNLFGTHHFRGGYDRENLSADASTIANGGYQYTLFTGPSTDLGIGNTEYVRSRFFQNGGVFTVRNEAFYIQDSWSLFDNRLTLQLGSRWDKFENKNADGVTFYESDYNWSPRFGFSFDPIGDNRTKVYGSFGRYYLPVAGNTNIRLAGSETDFDRYNVLNGLDANGQPILGAPITVVSARACPDTGTLSCRIRSDGTPASTISTVAENLNAQSLDEYIIGAEHRMTNNLRFNVYYTHSRLRDALEDSAIDPAVRAYCASIGNTECDDIDDPDQPWTGTHQYVLINPGKDAVVTLSDPLPGETDVRTITLSADDLGYPLAERKYDAVTFEFTREFDGVWSLQGSYTWTKLRGNYEGGVKSDNGQTDTGLTTDFDLPGLADGTFGPSPNERRHNFKLFGSYALTDWLTIGGNFQASSPRKFGCLGTVNRDRDPDAFDFYGAAGYYCRLDSAGNVITDTPADPSPPTPDGGGTPQNEALAALIAANPLVLTPRGSRFESDWLTNTNVDLIFKLPTDAFDGQFRVSVFNVFNQKAGLDFVEVGTTGTGNPSATYGQVQAYQAPRSVRMQLKVGF